MNSKRLRSTLRAAIAALAVFTAAPPAGAVAQLSCERIPRLIGAFFQKHIDFAYLDGTLRERAVDTYLNRIDRARVLYLRDESEALRARFKGVFHDVYSGDCSRLTELQKDVVKRTEALEATVRQLLTRPDYAVDPDVTLILDPKKRGHPVDEAAQLALIAKLVHFQMANYLSTDVELAEAKKKLVHRYELASKRAREVEPVDLHAALVDALASSLDPHSRYLSEEVWEDFQIDMNLSLDGIGVALSSQDGYSVVEKIIPGGATARLGALVPRDKIIAVAQENREFVDVIDMALRDVVRLIRGQRGTKVHLRVLRQTEGTESLTVTIVRDKIDLKERSAKLHFETLKEDGRTLKLAVLELPSFYGDPNPARRQSSRDVRRLLERAKAEKADGLLLDLSRNGGGLLQKAVEIAGFFIREGGIVAVRDSSSGLQVFRDADGEIFFDGPMAVLTSRVSASASEIVAGALKDHQRALIVGGDHTFGKGTVQNLVRLPAKLGALKVTTSMYFRPGGASTQHAGVTADVPIPSLWDAEDFGEKSQPYSLPGQTIESFVEVGSDAEMSRDRGYRPVQSQALAELARRSASRIAASDDFTEIERKLADARERHGVVQLAQILEEGREKHEEAGTEAEDSTAGAAAGMSDAGGNAAIAPPTSLPRPEDQDEPSPQQREALRILADYIALAS